jgi:hypothetical protein
MVFLVVLSKYVAETHADGLLDSKTMHRAGCEMDSVGTVRVTGEFIRRDRKHGVS